MVKLKFITLQLTTSRTCTKLLELLYELCVCVESTLCRFYRARTRLKLNAQTSKFRYECVFEFQTLKVLRYPKHTDTQMIWARSHKF